MPKTLTQSQVLCSASEENTFIASTAISPVVLREFKPDAHGLVMVYRKKVLLEK